MIAAKQDPTWIAAIGAIAALVAGALTALVTGWLGGREKVAEDLRATRLRVYPSVWRRTSVLSIWPTTDLTYGGLERLHLDLRRWYYTVGGLYLSEHARDRYGDLQKLIAVRLGNTVALGDTAVPRDVYDDLSQTASTFRTALTEDLESRRRRSLVWTLLRANAHRREGDDARRRLHLATAAVTGPGREVHYTLVTGDETLEAPAPG